MNVHEKCKENVPNLCGMELSERRGRIQLSLEARNDRLTVIGRSLR